MNPLLPKDKFGTDRQNLLDIWAVVNWLNKNRNEAIKEAADMCQVKDISAAIKDLGNEVELWHPNPPKRKWVEDSMKDEMDEAF